MQKRLTSSRDELISSGVQLALELRTRSIAVDDLLERCNLPRDVFYFHFNGIDELFDFAVVSSGDEVAELIEGREGFGGPAAIVLIDIWLAVLFGTAGQRPIVIDGIRGVQWSTTRNAYGQLVVGSHRLLLRAMREGDVFCAGDAYSVALRLARMLLTPRIHTSDRPVPDATALARAIELTARDIGIQVGRQYLRHYLVHRLQLLMRREQWRTILLDGDPPKTV
ncbi:hypothetical protein ACFYO1_26525 [Nocardia sp. NPDC006044]|uniref:hypothetical protein n=1 Tax=Nocardia sp. NPDC006044 TaxID=3364306 RepID=UPI0036A6DB5E